MKTSPRYLIAIYLPSFLDTTLRTLYQQAYGKPCPVRTLHTTLIPPFTIQDHQTIPNIQSTLSALPDFSVEFSTGKPGIFITNQRHIFYLPLLPEQPLSSMYHTLLTALKDSLTIETNGFRKNKLPEFVPHITLNYNFKEDPAIFNPAIEPFQLTKPQLLIEKEPGIWRPQ